MDGISIILCPLQFVEERSLPCRFIPCGLLNQTFTIKTCSYLPLTVSYENMIERLPTIFCRLTIQIWSWRSLISVPRAATANTFPVTAAALFPAAPLSWPATVNSCYARACVCPCLQETVALSHASVFFLREGFLIVTSVEFINTGSLCSVVIKRSIWPQTVSMLPSLTTSQTHHMSIWYVRACTRACVYVCMHKLTVYIIRNPPKPQQHCRGIE